MADQGFYTVLARKYRPKRFSELVAQEAISTTLRNALRSEKVYHAYLFTGPRGVGKTTSARILAKALNCPEATDWDPCGECPTCERIAGGGHDDVLEIDGASNNGIQQVRELRESAAYVPKESKHKIYIIDEVHMLSTAAFNGLLKTLEEPPPHVAFIMATTEPQKIPATVQSRCQRFDFKRLTPAEIGDRVVQIAAAEGIEIDDEAVYQIARLADGSMRDAQSHLDQLLAFCGEKISGADAAQALGVVPDELFLRCSELIGTQSPDQVFPFVETLYTDGHDPILFLRGHLDHLRTLIALGLGATPPEVERMPDALRQAHQELAERTPVGDLVRAARVVSEAERAIRGAANPRVELELTLVRLALLASTVDLREVLTGIEKGGGSPVGQGAERSGRASGRVPRPFEGEARGGGTAPAKRDQPAPTAAPPAVSQPPPDGAAPDRPSATPAKPEPPSAAASSTAPAAPPSAPSRPPRPEAVADLPAILGRRLHGDAPLVAATLAQAAARTTERGGVRLELPAASRAALTRATAPEAMALIEAVVHDTLGSPLEVQIVAAEGKEGNQRPTRVPGRAPKRHETGELSKIAAEEPRVREIMEHFDVGQ